MKRSRARILRKVTRLRRSIGNPARHYQIEHWKRYPRYPLLLLHEEGSQAFTPKKVLCVPLPVLRRHWITVDQAQEWGPHFHRSDQLMDHLLHQNVSNTHTYATNQQQPHPSKGLSAHICLAHRPLPIATIQPCPRLKARPSFSNLGNHQYYLTEPLV